MTPDITGLAGLFSRNFVIGNLAPSLLFVITTTFLSPLPKSLLLGDLGTEPSWSIIFFLFLFSTAIALFLHLANYQLIRFYEGYWPSPFHFLLFPSLRLQRWQYRRMKAKVDKLQNYEKYDLLIQFVDRFPQKEYELTPTKLGNMIRAFETYPYQRYRIDAVTLWPRLLTVIPEGQVSAIAEAVAGLNFFLNASFLTLSLVLTSILVSTRTHIQLVGFTVFLIALSYVFYQSACTRASWWGELVKSAFDVYRFDLLKQLHVQLPAQLSLQEERKLWEQIHWSMKYLRDPDPPIHSDTR